MTKDNTIVFKSKAMKEKEVNEGLVFERLDHLKNIIRENIKDLSDPVRKTLLSMFGPVYYRGVDKVTETDIITKVWLDWLNGTLGDLESEIFVNSYLATDIPFILETADQCMEVYLPTNISIPLNKHVITIVMIFHLGKWVIVNMYLDNTGIHENAIRYALSEIGSSVDEAFFKGETQ